MPTNAIACRTLIHALIRRFKRANYELIVSYQIILVDLDLVKYPALVSYYFVRVRGAFFCTTNRGSYYSTS